jgi:hypothetical protein
MIATENDLITLAFSRQDLERAIRQERSWAIDYRRLSGGAEVRHDTAAVAVVSRALMPLFVDALGALATELALAPATVIVLVPWKEPPACDTRPDGVVDSFMCGAATFRAMRGAAGSMPPAGPCFSLLEGILNRRLANDRLVVRQLPFPERPTPDRLDARAALIMAHRGDPRHLVTALESIARADDAHQVNVRVGLDVESLHDYVQVRERFPGVTFCQVDPAPAGLFVIRQHLLESADEEFFYLQDSDDASCSDRFTSQLDELRRTGADVVGCHELRVDEITRTVQALRLPLDVQKALSRGYSESLLNGTAVGVRRAVLRTGGYSTNRRIANDTQFMLRAYFLLRMRNIDGFFYLRRRHKASLTMAPETGLGTPVREGLRAQWAGDFEAILRGALRLEDSSLQHMRSDVDHHFHEWLAERCI